MNHVFSLFLFIRVKTDFQDFVYGVQRRGVFRMMAGGEDNLLDLDFINIIQAWSGSSRGCVGVNRKLDRIHERSVILQFGIGGQV